MYPVPTVPCASPQLGAFYSVGGKQFYIIKSTRLKVNSVLDREPMHSISNHQFFQIFPDLSFQSYQALQTSQTLQFLELVQFFSCFRQFIFTYVKTYTAI